ncbi:V-type ATPase 116kDa subunit family-domain-containing protein, partial [Baffinella frigidus]
MSQFRSEDMSLVQFFIQSDAAHDTLHELGHVGAIQFKDLNVEKSAFQRIFVQDVRKCDDMLRIVRYLQGMLERDKLTSHLDPPPPAMTLNNLHDKLLELEKEMKEQDSSHSLLKAQCIELEEHKQVLHNASKWFGQAYRAGVSFTAPTDDAEGRVEMSALLDDTEGGTQGRRSVSMLGHVAGCIPTANVHDFAVTLFRATRGNMHLKHQELDADVPDVEGEEELKTVFVVFYSGERSRAKVEKICESFGATKYRLPESTAQQDHMEGEVSERLRDLDIVLQRTNEYRRSKLRSIASAVQDWASGGVPYAEPVQLRRDTQVPHRRRLGRRLCHARGAGSAAAGDAPFWRVRPDRGQRRQDTRDAAHLFQDHQAHRGLPALGPPSSPWNSPAGRLV